MNKVYLFVLVLLSVSFTGCIEVEDSNLQDDLNEPVGEETAPGTALVLTRNAVESECPSGGTNFDIGVDDDGDGKLNSTEVYSTGTICNGADGLDGSSCKAIDNNNGTYTVSCSDGTSFTVSDGEQGLRGLDGSSCTATDNNNGTHTVSCSDGTSFTVSDGEQGLRGLDGSSCTATDNNNGTHTVSCSDGTSFTVSDGEQGPSGDKGQPGEDGMDGKNGTDAHIPPIPYEPWSAVTMLSEWSISNNYVWYQQFTASSTGGYQNMTLFATPSTTPTYIGTIGVAIYSDIPGNPGSPYQLLGQGTVFFNGTTDLDRSHITIPFVDEVNLTANTRYWVAIAGDHDPGENLYSGFHNDYNGNYHLVKHQTSGFSSDEGFPIESSSNLVNGEYAFWFRIF